ncbi:ferric-dicitrate binding protein FerR, regulates iron transport through sigma-19 [Pseudarcicella hirudinis]|uniref:Ferric-dicitrate binding protein FerR, regulates iron transport through sigma-19 n=1 Tax=Pseudarcicella hirudinis TaxID=1079859 RepID=A0A1I5NLU6_9BACT|nr:FecR family protein [Pseudarcicella hirudinis]SFP22773.1 ferric-dicitrate binding protein FerR, regulates iron transport through sigma-19 [Pseudarcicella hirudinis]
MKDANFIELVEKYQKGICTDSEKMMVENWLDSLASDENEFREFSGEEKLALKGKMQQAIKQKIALNRSARVIPFYRRVQFLRIAAILALAIGLGFYAGPFGRDIFNLKNETLLLTSNGITQKVILSDGSIIWLKGKSTLSYPEEFLDKNREVSLNGEALFEVAKDPSHPFIIHSGGFVTRVLGTSFNIRKIGKKMEVVVFTGKVTVSGLNSPHPLVLLPEEKAVFISGNTSVNKEIYHEKNEYLAGTEYNMNFEDSRMEDILSKIESKFDVKVKVEDPKILNCLITADFTDQSLQKTFELLCQALNGRFEIEGNTVKLQAEGCE